jgi:transposase
MSYSRILAHGRVDGKERRLQPPYASPRGIHLGGLRQAKAPLGQKPRSKQEVNLGKRNNQNLVSVPHARFIAMLTYKAALVGIQVLLTEESYTSQASFLDADPLPVYGTGEAPAFSGRRVKRGLYRAADGRDINADVNGAYNIMRKVAPEAFAQGSSGCVVHPMRLTA